jgi:hypothetical protein
MEYTKDELVRMKAKLIRYYSQEKRNNSLLRLLRCSALLFTSGTFVSLSMYLEKLQKLEDSVLIGASCGALALTTGVSSVFLNRETNKLEDEIFEYELNCPDQVIEEAYESVYRRR